ncbi:MAG: ABC transporter permease [Sphingomonas sp.]|uniref:MlaE family ABC transporter permease n=1 Tax=Sphingomonas sp. TaxID=28214 RepID=UPI00262171AF|nr:ABC transporter permease [Sphingomonas sp.]MDK2768125.1 ABC transporter permease [Sphingomonas sp.]
MTETIDGLAASKVTEQVAEAQAFDLSQLGRLDSAGAMMISELAGERSLPPAPRDDAQILFDLVMKQDLSAHPKVRDPWLDRIGKHMVGAAEEALGTASFLGKLEVALARSVVHPTRVRLTSLVSAMQHAGFEALPIICIMTFFVGAVVALVGSDLLDDLAASALVVQLVTVSILREFGVLIPAILLAGRSTSTFAAQLGAMRMNQEVDAIEVMGIDPIDALVVPRVISMLIVMPLLVFAAMIAGIVGGAVVSWATMDISPTFFVERMLNTVSIRHFWVGMAKVPILALVVAITGCRQGLSVDGGVEVLGRRVTTAVVRALFSIIFLDAIFAVICSELDF